MIPLMSGEFVVLPTALSYLSFIAVGLAAIQEARSGHIGRIALAANVFLLWQVFYPHWGALPGLVEFYLNAGTVLAIVGLGTYLVGHSLPAPFYRAVFVLYGSLSIILVLSFGVATGFA